MVNDTESPATFWASAQEIVLQVLQIIDVRLALVIGLAAFMLAVGFDSSGNQAEAADLMGQSSLVSVTVSVGSAEPALPYIPASGSVAAHRLRHGTLTSAIITSNRLTDAHFFTELPSDQ
ncbi:hypothetical protein IQ254_08530 [Nodosilinea sp. LEGE 07088]|uniref:hypothetical protein n=1 Tax=Nodosilinea sp. LEGE 07088 TaxID=2777968 RepID=UPI00187E0E63|nr:hypothetical protein [Nodosilinea sp. LEGE 07088]MBE9137251.1 hypothetical protein [Nodosilinea sp. LEGE 07088]